MEVRFVIKEARSRYRIQAKEAPICSFPMDRVCIPAIGAVGKQIFRDPRHT